MELTYSTHGRIQAQARGIPIFDTLPGRAQRLDTKTSFLTCYEPQHGSVLREVVVDRWHVKKKGLGYCLVVAELVPSQRRSGMAIPQRLGNLVLTTYRLDLTGDKPKNSTPGARRALATTKTLIERKDDRFSRLWEDTEN